jgi:hypothetical protein
VTITATATSSGPYTATADDTFAVTFQSASATEIRVTLDGVDVSPAGYTFERDSDGTGEVIFDTPVTGVVMIYSQPLFTQTTEFLRHGAFYPDQMNGPLDRGAIKDLYLLSLVGTTAGPPGDPGDDAENPAFSFAINTLAAGASATLDTTGVYPNLLLTFGIPRGNTGAQGIQGPEGDPATNPNYTYVINTLSPGTSATLSSSGSYPNITLTFGIPRGDPGASGALGDGVYGDITVSGTGTVLTVGNDKITYAKMQNVSATSRILGRITAGAGDVEELTAANIKTILALVKADVGLGNVDNTSDASKPVSTDQQTALNLKADLASPALTGNPTAPTQTAGDASTKLASTAFVDRLRDLPLVRATASPTAALTDRGGVVEATSSAALPANSSVAFPVGSLVIFYNNSGSPINLTITTDTLRLVGTASTGTRVIAQRGYAYCRKRATTEWTVSGDVS